jgi:hypothetical protein
MAGEIRQSLGMPFKTGITQSPNAGANLDDNYTLEASTTEAAAASEYTTAYAPETPTGVVPKSSNVLADEAFVPKERASVLATIGANMGRGGIAAWQTVESWQQETDYNWNPTPFIDTLGKQMGGLSQKEIKYLASSVSEPDYKQKITNMLDVRDRDNATRHNPVTGALASIIDVDILIGATPFKVGKALVNASKVGRTAARVGSGVVVGGATAGFYAAAGENTTRTDDQIFWDTAIMGLSGMLRPMAKGNTVAPVVDAAGAVRLTDATTAREVALAAAARQHDEAVDVVLRGESIEAAKAAQRSTRADTASMEAYEKALAAAKVSGRTDAEILLEPKHIRGQLRQARAAERLEAIAEVEATKPVPSVPTTPIVSTDSAAIKALETEYKAAQEAIELEFKNSTTVPPAASTSAERAAQEVLDDLAAPRPTGTPTDQIKKTKWYNKFFSVADRLDHYAQNLPDDHVVKRLLSSPAKHDGADATSIRNVFQYDYMHKMSAISDEFIQAIKARGVGTGLFSRGKGDFAKARKEVGLDFQVAMQKTDSEALAFRSRTGQYPDKVTLDAMVARNAGSPEIEILMQKYINSDLAIKTHADMLASGKYMVEQMDELGNKTMVNLMDDIITRPTYLPLKHDYEKYFETVFTKGLATADEAASFIGHQIAKMYPTLLNPIRSNPNFKLTETQLGQHYIATQKDTARSLADVTASGLSVEQIAKVLTETGEISVKDSVRIAEDMFKSMHEAGTSLPKHLRRRIEWDWDTTFKTESGYDLSMRDFINDDVMLNLEDYTRGVANSNALAAVGIKSEAELLNALDEVMDALPAGTSAGEARAFLKNVADSVQDKAIEGTQLPTGVRIAQSVAGLYTLVNGGILSLMELATQTQKVGLLRSIPAMRQGMKAVFKPLSKFNYEQATELQDILTGKILTTSQWKNFTTRTSDNFAVTSGLVEASEFAGQATRFANLSEYVRRFQVGILASVYASTLKKAMGGSVRDLKFLTDELKLSDSLIEGVRKEFSTHGTNVDAWAQGVRVPFERQVFNNADNMALSIQRGETPALMEHSAVGNVILPFMQFSFSAQNKVMRRTHRRDGNAGFALLMAVQLPTAFLIGGAVNVRRGKELDEDIEINALRALSGFGSMNFFAELAFAGMGEGGAIATVPFAKGHNLIKGITTDEDYSLKDAQRDSPLNSFLILSLLNNAFDEES